MNKRRTLLLVGGICAAALCLVVAGGFVIYRVFLPPLLIGRRDAARPTVSILAPQNGAQVAAGSAVVVQAEGTAEGSQVVLMQLWVDGALIGEQGGAAERLNTSWSWLPLTPGDHTLAVRAYNARNDAGLAMVRVTAIEGADADRDGILDSADTCPDRAGLLQLDGCPPGMAGGVASNPDAQQVADAWVGPGVESATGVRTIGEPGVIEGGQQRPEIGGSDFPPGQRAIEQNCLLCSLQEQQQEGRYGHVGNIIGVELEVLSLRTAEAFSDVYCFVRVQGEPWERVPTDDDEFFASEGDGFWSIDAYLGGENGRTIAVDEEGTLSLQASCHGRLGDMLRPSLHLGEVSRVHGPGDWNGQTFTAHGEEGANWFDVSYRICPGTCEGSLIPPPYDLQVRRQEGASPSYVLTWRWDGDASAIDGFEIYRNGNYIEFSGSTFAFLSPATAEPPAAVSTALR